MENFDLQQYQFDVLRTAPFTNNRDKLCCGALGLAGESGEVIDMIKKHLYQGHDIDYSKLCEELGDVLWYITVLCSVSDTFDLRSVMELNIAKLKLRYPNGFTSKDSIERSI